MKLSARNRIKGKIVDVKKGATTAHVKIDVGGGQIISRTGHYRVFPIIGTVLLAGGLWLFSTMGVDTPKWETSVYMVVLGAGMGCLMQTTSLIAQNSVTIRDLGAATGASTFVRNLGGAIGTSFLVSYLTRHRQISRIDLVSHLHHGNVFFDRYLAGMQQSAISTGMSASAAGQRSLAQLQQLVELKQSGMLTDEEFSAAKARLLGA